MLLSYDRAEKEMKKYELRKGLVIGIIILFFGASVVQSITVNDETVSDVIDEQTFYTADDDVLFDGSWSCRKKITIYHTKVDGDLDNFPVLIRHTSSELATHAQADGDDFVFTTVDGTKLNHEIEYYDEHSGELVAWVNVPSLSSALDTILYMYYGNPICSNQQNMEDTWDSHFVMVQHLVGAGTTTYDSTANDNDGTKGGSNNPSETNGKIGKAQQFHGFTEGNIDITTETGLSFNYDDAFTFECWIKTSQIPNGQTVSSLMSDYDQGPATYFGLMKDGGKQRGDIFDSDEEKDYRGSNNVVDGNWHHLVWTWYNNILKLYCDGSEDTNVYRHINDLLDGSLDNDNPMHLGCDERNGPKYPYQGILDEARISNVDRSSIWISTQYNNQNDPESFMTVGDEIPIKTAILIGRITNLNTEGFFTTFDVVRLRFLQFSPFSFNTYISGEKITVIKSKLGMVTENFAFFKANLNKGGFVSNVTLESVI